MGLGEFLSQLAVPPGSLAFHLIRLAVLVAGLALSYNQYRESRAQESRASVWAFGLALVFQFGAAIAPELGAQGAPWLAGFLELCLAAALTWGLGYPHGSRSSALRYAPSGLAAVTVLVALVYPSTDLPLWALGSVTIFALGTGFSAAHPSTDSKITLVAAFILLGAGSLIQSLPAILPGIAGWSELSFVGGGRLLALAGFLVLMSGLYLQMTTDWQEERTGYDSELQSLSQSSLQQTQERLFLLQVTQAVGATLDLRQVLDTAAESLALGGQADRATIALTQETDSTHLHIASEYAILSREEGPPEPVHFRLENFPSLQAAARGGKAVLLANPSADRRSSIEATADHHEIIALHSLLRSTKSGPLLIQPLLHQDSLMGVIVLSNAASGRAFSPDDQRYCAALSSQITSAIANARLYQRVTRLLGEQAADASQRQAILESIADGVIASDRSSTVIMINSAAARMLDRDAQEVVGRSLEAICPMLWAGSETGQTSFELNRRVIRGNIALVKSEGGEELGNVAILRDVTQEIQAERAKSRFVATVSHELRTPMTAIKGYVDMMAAGLGGELNESQLGYVDIILANTERMVNIVNNMITISEMEGEIDFFPEPTDLPRLVQKSIEALDLTLQRNQLTLEYIAPASSPPVIADPLRLRHVIDNLLSNACKFTPKGGSITVTISTLDEQPVSSRDDGYMVVAVSDTGVGIPVDERARIFERFYRADNRLSIQAGGPGVGLTIAKELIERHGGRIWVDSEVGEGSTFTFIIPLAPDPSRKMFGLAPLAASDSADETQDSPALAPTP